jgi:hypothetical protein
MPTETDLPFEFTRLQFPIGPCFSMSINKAQGQTLEFVSIWLGDDHVFTHGQLYVALSRVSAFDNIRIATNYPNLMTRNVHCDDLSLLCALGVSEFALGSRS